MQYKLTYQYQSHELMTLIQRLREERSSGILYLNFQVSPQEKPRSRVLVWYQGEITYGGFSIPDSETFVRQIGALMKPAWIDSALKFTEKKISQPGSTQELVSLLVKMRIFEWTQVESWIQHQVIFLLEEMLPHAGQAHLQPDVNFDLHYGDNGCGLNWAKLTQTLTDRERDWQSLSSDIPSMEAIPCPIAPALEAIADAATQQHIQQWVDGKHSLIEIAQKLNQDPLKLAKAYRYWAKSGWLTFSQATGAVNADLPTILSVDDSPIIQTMIKRALGEHYEVLTAGSAIEALNLLNQNSDRLSLLILDLTMPDIDGLELCRTIRNIPRFRELPIIMLTARDGLINRLKGQLAGSDCYLTKPFEPEKLLQLVSEYAHSRADEFRRSKVRT